MSVLDASAAIVLFASGSIEPILGSWRGPVGMVDRTLDEVLFLRDRDSLATDGTKQPISFSSLIASGLIQVLTIDSDAEHVAFQRVAEMLDDGEAAAAAVAIERGYELIIDERKAHTVLSRSVKLSWSLELVRHWIETDGIESNATKAILTDIRIKASYAPHRAHPHYEWWRQFGPAA